MSEGEATTIVIAGGGTAGWMAAASFAHFLEIGYRIILVESEEIGTVGVGEATIPQIRLFNSALGLDENAFLRATQGTFKLGIEFEGWKQPGHSYMHAFGDVGRDTGPALFHHNWVRARQLGKAKTLDAYAMNEVAARTLKMQRGPARTANTLPEMPYAFHFDAGLYAAYLRRFAEARGVERIEGKIAEVELRGSDGYVEALMLDADRRVDGDIFIDCTGFRGLLIEGALETGYEDWSHWLPCNRALAVPCNNGGEFTPYTRSSAREAGWQWRIPLQHRIGNGYVYCSDYVSDEDAAKTLLGNLNGEPQAEPRPIRFVTGKRKKIWNRNVIAFGLASGFMEPLESTSIHLIQSAISRFFKIMPGKAPSPADAAEFNRQSDFEYERIRDFLILHYKLNERPEPFWQSCREMPIPDSLAHKMELFRANGHIVREQEELFTEVGWLQVLVGQGMMPAGYHPLVDAIPADDLGDYMETLELLIAREVRQMESHFDFIAANCAAPPMKHAA